MTMKRWPPIFLPCGTVIARRWRGRYRHAHQFSWDRSMEALFGRIYRDALAARAGALVGGEPLPSALARAA